jgi:hypothetical protein
MNDDDLHGRQLVLLLLFFGTVGGGLYFLGRLTQPSFFYDNPLVCAAIAGGACYPARFLVERFDWWKARQHEHRIVVRAFQGAVASVARRYGVCLLLRLVLRRLFADAGGVGQVHRGYSFAGGVDSGSLGLVGAAPERVVRLGILLVVDVGVPDAFGPEDPRVQMYVNTQLVHLSCRGGPVLRGRKPRPPPFKGSGTVGPG